MRAADGFPTPEVAADAGRLRLVEDSEARLVQPAGLELTRLPACEAVVLTKRQAGVEAASADAIAAAVDLAAAGRLGRPKYLALDFAHAGGGPEGGGDPGAPARELRNLVLRAPVVPVAFVRAPLGGADLELAFSCSLVIAEQGASFDFGVGPEDFPSLYPLLAEKVGFVRTERLLEPGLAVGAEALRDQLLVREVAPAGAGLGFLEAYLGRHLRRHNSFHSIYRAQRMVAPPGQLAARG
jgi:hypothetical protein